MSAGRLDPPVTEIVDRYPPYQEFCDRHPRECKLDGEDVVVHDDDLIGVLVEVNTAVNAEVKFTLDSIQYGREDYWALPTTGLGDCEDIALEKRARLAARGLARGALRLAFAYHRTQMTPHSVLTVETTHGTFILDSQTDQVHRWDQTAYNFEARERVDGFWDRYDQSDWTYE